MPPFRETVDPTAEQGSLHEGQPTPFPQTSQPPGTEFYTHTHAYLTDSLTHTTAHSVLRRIIHSLSWPFFLSHISPQTPSQWLWLFGGCRQDPVTRVQNPHTVSHFPVNLYWISSEKWSWGWAEVKYVSRAWFSRSCACQLHWDHISVAQTVPGVDAFTEMLWFAEVSWKS